MPGSVAGSWACRLGLILALMSSRAFLVIRDMEEIKGRLTVGKGVLQRVDTVQHNDTWKGDPSEHDSTIGAPEFFKVASEDHKRSKLRDIRAFKLFEYAYRQRRRGSWAWLQAMMLVLVGYDVAIVAGPGKLAMAYP